MLISRPKQLDEFVGQESIKRKARIAIGAALERSEPLPHCLLTSRAGGLGKTSFASCLANECFAPLVATTGQCLATAEDLRNVLIRLRPNSFLLIDECHCLGKLAGEELLLVLEDGVLNVNVAGGGAPLRLELPPFTLVAATTKPEAVPPPLTQRFGLSFRFDFYSNEELGSIVRASSKRMGVNFSDDVCDDIARRSMGIPRIALRLAERVRDMAQARGLSVAGSDELNQAMAVEGIDELGLTAEHRELLNVLVAAGSRAVSARNLALVLGTGVETVVEVLEPPLIRLGLLHVGPGGRRISERGLLHLDDPNPLKMAR